MAVETAGKVISNSSWIDEIQGVMQNQLSSLLENIFNSVSKIIHGQASYTIVGLIVCIWLLKQLRTGYPTQDELFSAGKWIIVTCFVFAAYASYDNFTTILGWFYLPASWVISAMNDALGNQIGNSLAQTITNLMNNVSLICSTMLEKAYEASKSDAWFGADVANIFIKAYVAITMFPTYFFAFMYYMLCFAIAAIVIASVFIAMLILSFAPLVVCFLNISFLKPYFFSWLKLFITYSLFAPIALFVTALASKPIADIQSMSPAELGNIYLEGRQCDTFLVPTLCAFLCIFLLRKIPVWISQILGVNNLDGGGSNVGSAAVGMAGKLAGVGAVGAVAGRVAGTGALKNALGSMGQSLPGGSTIASIMKNAREAGKGVTNSSGTSIPGGL